MTNEVDPALEVDAASAKMMRFVLGHNNLSPTGLRLGQLSVRGRPHLPTPAPVIPTSRGVVPHVTNDLFARLPTPCAVYIGLEDFVEKTLSKAPLVRQPNQNGSSKLHEFVSLPDHHVSIFGPRRVPVIETPSHNTNSSIAISTSVGFQSLAAADYTEAALHLRADITVGLGDVVTAHAVSQKRKEKSADRTHAWTRDMLAARVKAECDAPLFAPVPPLESHEQSFYLSDLSEEYRSDIAGVALYASETAMELPHVLEDIPRLCLTDPRTPQELLRTVSLGNDLITVPFVTECSESGIAMTFSFTPEPALHDGSLGFDLTQKVHDKDTSSLVDTCDCYTCHRHHRAYIHHLLSAKEMLAWTLLQIHNLHILNRFFTQIRASIGDGTFEKKCQAFNRAYQPEMPAAQAEGPRIRGYQMKSGGGGEPKKNKKVYGRLDEHAMKLAEAESGVATPESGTKAGDLEQRGLGEVQ